ncbi:hypothetical protein DFP72DRAFT_924113 [Ephemerocybe angulata]|uniref:Uncharacterized protein n=1 Tax=Ephemerocybe angulata TaxID=980116 RepID=A0A8H6HF42_9AGAR|nr:hypothetical protein DFP72DRAFT_924113 [Tulosesus angulatus]
MATPFKSEHYTCDHTCHSPHQVHVGKNREPKPKWNVGVISYPGLAWASHQTKYHTACQCPNPDTLHHLTTPKEFVKFAARIYLSRRTEGMKERAMEQYREAWSLVYEGDPPLHDDGGPLDLALDERYEVDVTWGHIPVEPLKRPHPLGPPPVLRVQDSESLNLATERRSTSTADDSSGDASMHVDSDRPEIPSLPAHQGSLPRDELSRASADTEGADSRTPLTYPPSRLMPIPPIVDHLLSEIDELKEALAVEVENQRRRDAEVRSLREEFLRLRDAIEVD